MTITEDPDELRAALHAAERRAARAMLRLMFGHSTMEEAEREISLARLTLQAARMPRGLPQ